MNICKVIGQKKIGIELIRFNINVEILDIIKTSSY